MKQWKKHDWSQKRENLEEKGEKMEKNERKGYFGAFFEGKNSGACWVKNKKKLNEPIFPRSEIRIRHEESFHLV